MANRLPRAPAQPRTVSPRERLPAPRPAVRPDPVEPPDELPAAPEVPPPEAPTPGPRAARIIALLSKPAAVWAAVLLGGALRIAHAIAIGRSPLAERLILDHRAYDAWAQRIAAGDWLGRGIFWVDPLYSYVLAALYALFGRDLTLVRSEHPIFLLGWILMHEIDETSPLFGATAESLAAGDAMLLLTIEGSDETAAQTLQARHSWQHDEIRWGYRFVDLMHDEGSVTHVDYGNFHEIVPVDEPAGQA